MKAVKTLLLCLFALLQLCCSRKEDMSAADDIPGLGGDVWTPGIIDRWIYDTLTRPYNIAVKYKWDQFEFELDKTLVPPKEEKVIPALEAIRRVWIDTYIEEAGPVFFKKHAPKFFILSGSASWNPNGTITLGTAEGGRKVVLYLVNEFRKKGDPGYRPSDSITLKMMFSAVEHEFAHILHQQVMYQPDFKKISTGLYTANWNIISDLAARRDGFVTAYAMSTYDEDFVEMISVMLVEGREGFEKIVNSIPPGISDNGITQDEARLRLRKKEAMVVSYFKSVWSMDFYRLQTRTRRAIEKLLY